MLNRRLNTSSLNFLGHVSSICFMAIESIGIQISPDSLLCEACHPCNIAIYLQWNILWILGNIHMYLNILWGGPCDLPFFIYGTSHDHISDISLCIHILLYIEYNHSGMNDMIFTQQPTFSTAALSLHNYRSRHYHSSGKLAIGGPYKCTM